MGRSCKVEHRPQVCFADVNASNSGLPTKCLPEAGSQQWKWISHIGTEPSGSLHSNAAFRSSSLLNISFLPLRIQYGDISIPRNYTHGGREIGDLKVQVEPKIARGEMRTENLGDGIRKLEKLVENDDLFRGLGLHKRIVSIMEQIL